MEIGDIGMKEEFKSRVYTDRPQYADYPAAQNEECVVFREGF